LQPRSGQYAPRAVTRTHRSSSPPRRTAPAGPLRLHGAIARRLGIAILSGRYRPGRLLDNEVVSSEQLAVSRSAYREAVRILSAKGLVEARPRVGTRVTPRSRWTLLDPQVIEWMFESEPAQSVLNSLFELRKIVECAAAALAARRRSARHLRTMRRALEAMARYTLATPQGRQADLDFHRALLESTGNAFIISLTNGMSAAISTTTVFKQRERPLRRDPLPEHRRVFEAIAAGDAIRAQRAMSELIVLARRDMPPKSGARRTRARTAHSGRR